MKNFRTLILAASLAIAATACTDQPRIVAVGTQNSPTLFGELKGSTLCKYVYLVNGVDPKTKKPTTQLAYGGKQYGGTGCIELHAIEWVEPLDAKSPLYAAIH